MDGVRRGRPISTNLSPYQRARRARNDKAARDRAKAVKGMAAYWRHLATMPIIQSGDS